MMSGYTRRSVATLPLQEQRWALAGFVLALVLLALLVWVINENAAQAESRRNEAARKMQERGLCNALPDRRERQRCLLDLRLGEQAQIAGR